MWDITFPSADRKFVKFTAWITDSLGMSLSGLSWVPIEQNMLT